MVITNEYKTIIEKMVTSNKRFKGNEDLLEDFCAEALEKCCFLLQKTDEISRIENYLNKIISSAIISVLKSSGRLIRSIEGYKNNPQKTVSIENPLDDGFYDIKDTSISFVERVVQRETLQEVYNLVAKFNDENPNEGYATIFYMKYVQGKKQREIASALNISQGEVSKRLFNLMKKINSNM